MEQLLAEPIKAISANPWGAAWIVTVVLLGFVIRAMWREIGRVRDAAESALARKDELLQRERDARIEDMRSVERLSGAVEGLGDKLLDIASNRRRA